MEDNKIISTNGKVTSINHNEETELDEKAYMDMLERNFVKMCNDLKDEISNSFSEEVIMRLDAGKLVECANKGIISYVDELSKKVEELEKRVKELENK